MPSLGKWKRAFSQIQRQKKNGKDSRTPRVLPSIDNRPLTEQEEEAKKKIEVIFLKIDDSGNGCLEPFEFREFIKKLGVHMTDEEFEHLVRNIDIDESGKIEFDEFFYYYRRLLYGSKGTHEYDANVKDKLNTNETLNTLSQGVFEKRNNALLLAVINELKRNAGSKPDSSLNDLIDKNKLLQQESSFDQLDGKFSELVKETDAKELSEFIQQRWNSFTDFQRKGATGDVVMVGGKGATDALPGEYDLVELVMSQYANILDMKTPKYAVIKAAKWMSATKDKKDGKLICPNEWDGIIPVDIGTNQLLGYYGACLANQKEEKVALLQRHGTVDFTYTKGYHDTYVLENVGGNGIEKHGFHHMDCPMDDNSGFFILGKYVEDNLHLTAFKIPKNHVLYVPPNTIHSNDHLLGCWRTMLSDCSEAPIDHVILMKNSSKRMKKYDRVDLKFDTTLLNFGVSGVSEAVCMKSKE